MRVGWVIALLVVVVTAKECAYRAPGSDDFYDLSPLVAASDAPLDAFLSGTSDDLGLFYLNLCDPLNTQLLTTNCTKGSNVCRIDSQNVTHSCSSSELEEFKTLEGGKQGGRVNH